MLHAEPTLAAMIRSVLLSVARGFVMGAADIVPGVSGGTIALIFGIYERLIASVRAGSSALGNLAKLDLTGFKKWMGRVDWLFIIPISREPAQFFNMVLIDAPRGGAMLFAERGGIPRSDTHLSGGIHDARAAETDMRTAEAAPRHHQVFNIPRIEAAERDVVDFNLPEERYGKEILFSSF